VQGTPRGRQLKAFARVGALGIELAVSTVIGLLGGRWLDAKLGTEPSLAIVGLLLGVTAGFRSLYLTAKRQLRQAPEADPDPNPDQPNEPKPPEPPNPA
jgi:F0F1-type ATP synthase assembly protein I